MLSFPSQTRVYLCAAPLIFARASTGCAASSRACSSAMCSTGHLFLFFNKRRDRVKALYWDRDGVAIWYKRLERGSYEMPRPGGDAPQIELDATELAMLLGGVSLAGVKRRKRYQAQR